MSVSSVERPVSALRQRMLEDMARRGLRSDTQHDYVRVVRSFAAFLGHRCVLGEVSHAAS
jgi:integrase/recombinase XerD